MRCKSSARSKASSRWGHGKTRTLKPMLVLTGKAERWRQTKCQVIARQFARWVHDHGYTCVYMEDFSAIRDSLPERMQAGKRAWDLVQEWPYYQLGQRMQSCLEELGIQTVTVPAQQISQICPLCGTTDKSHIDLKHRKFRCSNPECLHVDHLDAVAARNVLTRGLASGEAGPDGEPNDSGKVGKRKKPAQRAARKPARNQPTAE